MNDKLELEEILKILVYTDASQRIEMEHDFGKQVMVPFTGEVLGPLFKGKVLPGGVDTQEVRIDGMKRVSARYFLETDEGEKIYIENNGIIRELGDGKRYFRTIPHFVTESKKYSWLNDNIFVGTGERTDKGLEIVIYKLT